MLGLYKERIIIDKELLPKSASINKLISVLDEEDARLLIQFIFLIYDRTDNNPLKDFPLANRIQKVKEITFNDSMFSIEKSYRNHIGIITQAINEYKKETIDKVQKDIDLYDKKIYQFITLLKDNEPEIVKNTHDLTGRITFSTNIDIITTILDNSINIILDKAALVLMQKTGKFSRALRGQLSPNTTGKLIKK